MSVLRIIPVALLLAACSRPAVQQVTVQPGGSDAASSITAADMRARIAYLSSDALRGRDTPSPGLDTAAAYIAREFQRFGLEPGGENGTFFQRYPFTVRIVNADASRWEGMRYGRDYFVWPGTPLNISGDLVKVTGPLADAAPTDVRGKVVLITVPGAMDRTWRTAVNSARNAAVLAGVKGLIVSLDASITESDVASRAAAYQR